MNDFSNNNYYKKTVAPHCYRLVCEQDMKYVDAGILTKTEAELRSYIRAFGEATFTPDYVACMFRCTEELIEKSLKKLLDLGLVEIVGVSPYKQPLYSINAEADKNLEPVQPKPVENDITESELYEVLNKQQALFEQTYHTLVTELMTFAAKAGIFEEL